jgi:ADP-ribose 1''-phosphate phosphatase
MPLVYKQGDALKVNADIIVHACNLKGSWGGGTTAFATQLKIIYPQAFMTYNDYCSKHDSRDAIGTSLLISGNPQIGCLFTSVGYGYNKSKESIIIGATKTSLRSLLQQLDKTKTIKIVSPKFNAGLFKIPWEVTEEILLEKLQPYPNITWEVFFP